MTTETNDLAVLFPGRDVTCQSETVRVVPLYFGQLPTAAKLARPLVMALADSGLFSMQGTQLSLSENWIAGLPMLFDQGGEAVLMFLAFTTGKPRAWFDTLAIDEGIALAQAVFEENRSFFHRKVQPMLLSAGLLKVSTESAGGTSLPDSSEPAIAGLPTSSASA